MKFIKRLDVNENNCIIGHRDHLIVFGKLCNGYYIAFTSPFIKFKEYFNILEAIKKKGKGSNRYMISFRNGYLIFNKVFYAFEYDKNFLIKHENT